MSQGKNATVGTSPWWAKAMLIGSVAAAALLPIGALGTRVGLWSFQGGFIAIAAGVVLASVGLVVGVAALVASIRRKLPLGRPPVYAGLVLCVAVLVIMGAQFWTAYSVPAIHDISTDTMDPPQFDELIGVRGEQANSLEYDAATLEPLQQRHYPWVVPFVTEASPPAAFQLAMHALKGLGLQIVNEDASAGLIEATATTFWFGFKDDVAVRVRAADGGSVVDLRSVSRVGVSDLGTNARRIGQILSAMTEAETELAP